MLWCGGGGVLWCRYVSWGNVLSCAIMRCYCCGCGVVSCGWHSVVSQVWFDVVCGMLCRVV